MYFKVPHTYITFSLILYVFLFSPLLISVSNSILPAFLCCIYCELICIVQNKIEKLLTSTLEVQVHLLTGTLEDYWDFIIIAFQYIVN